jgi:PAS domain S-box-containing protein
VIGLAAITAICSYFRLHLGPAAFAYILLIAPLSMLGSYGASIVLSLIATACLSYFFARPLFDVRVDYLEDLVAVAAFVTTSLIVTALTTRVRNSAAAARVAQQRLIDTLPALLWSADPDGSRDFHNRRWLEFAGISPAEAVGDGWMSMFHPEDRDTVVKKWRAAVESGEMFEVEARAQSATGEYRALLVRAAPSRDERGAVVKWYGVSTDIEDRKRAEQAREQLEVQWKAAFESNPTMYFIIDAAGIVVSVNAFGAEQLGYAVGELIGQQVLNVFYGPDRAFIQEHAKACFAQPGRMMRWEARKIRKNGTMLSVRETANAIILHDQPVLLVVCEDITEQKHAEEAAGRSEQELRDAIEAIPTVVWIAGPDGLNAFVNRRWAEYTGLSAEDTAGAGWQSAVHPGDAERHVSKWRAAVASGEPYEDEVRFRGADGEYRWFLVRGVPLRDERGEIVKWYGIMTDMEDRKRAEDFLAGEKRVLEIVARGDSLRQILDSICLLVEQQTSRVFASILLVDGNRLRHGSAPSLPKAYADAIDGIEIGPAVGSCGTAAYRGEQVIVEDIAIDPLWTAFREFALPHGLRACWSTPIFSSEGEVIATFAMYYGEVRRPSLRDQQIIEQITHLAGVAIQRRLTEEKLQRSESYLQEAQRLSHTGSWARRWSGGPGPGPVVYCSEELLRMWGFEPQEGVPSGESFDQRIHREDLDKVHDRFREAARTRGEYANDFRIVLADGTIRYIQSIGHAVLDTDEEVLEFVGTAVDVTERKHAEQERDRLRQLEADLAHVNRLTTMGELTASLAHEINQPIAAAITNANACLRWLTRDSPDLQEARKAAKRIVVDGTRAADIISRLRSFYRKGTPQQRELLDVNDVTRDMLKLLRGEANRNSVLMRTALRDLPLVPADRVQLQQVFMNLMLNAIEAMKESGGELSITTRLAEDGGLLISVSDTGIGLPAGKADQMFKAFFTTKPQGTGMGLAISRSIIESHGGRLWASDNATRGATFYFTLPQGELAHA